MRLKVSFLPKSRPPISIEGLLGFVKPLGLSAAAEAIIGLSREKAALHALSSAYWSEMQKLELAQGEWKRYRSNPR